MIRVMDDIPPGTIGVQAVAVVTDAEWLENSIKAFGRMMPGDIKVFAPDEILEAKQWLVDVDDEHGGFPRRMTWTSRGGRRHGEPAGS